MQTEPGHVFVVGGDITQLACDAWLVPTDRGLNLEDHWTARIPRLNQLKSSTAAAELKSGAFAAAAPDWPANEPLPILATVPFTGVESFGHLAPRLQASLRIAADSATGRSSGRSPFRLVALPAFGTGRGGGGRVRGELLGGILQTAGEVARDAGVDVALVLRDSADFAVAQRIRRDTWQWPLSEQLKEEARRLAKLGDEGILVPFLGAGVSKAAGLPLWGELVALLLNGVDFPENRVAAFQELSVLDQALLLRRMYDDQGRRDFNTVVAGMTEASRYGLASVMLAGLPAREAVTLNYDTLYERACRALGQPLTVLPDEQVVDAGRWLLKLHGSVSDPGSIVLTREDYLGYGHGRDALSALAKAMLMTRHLLFVGFGLADDHFHELMHDVRMVFPRRAGGHHLGTALMVGEDALREELWRHDVHIVPLMPGGTPERQARQLEVFLDMLLAFTGRGSDYFLRPSYEPLLTDDERLLRGRLIEFVKVTSASERGTPAWVSLRAALEGLGWTEEG